MTDDKSPSEDAAGTDQPLDPEAADEATSGSAEMRTDETDTLEEAAPDSGRRFDRLRALPLKVVATVVAALIIGAAGGAGVAFAASEHHGGEGHGHHAEHGDGEAHGDQGERGDRGDSGGEAER